MSTALVICDDSAFARKQILRSLPGDWDVTVTQVGDGSSALAAIRAGNGDVLLLDLNMPGMDGYQVMEVVQREKLATLIIVVSGDVQPEIRRRVLALGALELLKKPTRSGDLLAILTHYGLYRSTSFSPPKPEIQGDVSVDLRDVYRELANVAQGWAADRLARLLKTFVSTGNPAAITIEGTKLQAVLGQMAGSETVIAVSQGFAGGGLAGEVLLIFKDSSTVDMARLLGLTGFIDTNTTLDVVLDVASVLIGASLAGIGEQLDLSFSLGHPIILGRHVSMADLLAREGGCCKGRLLAMRLSYTIAGHNVNAELLLLFTPTSLPVLQQRVHYASP